VTISTKLRDEEPEDSKTSVNFIRRIIAEDLSTNKHNGRVVTRFPPEPNGYLHVGHAKSICLNFGLAEENQNGTYHLRFDDTNPEKEETEYVTSIQADIRWLGFDWGDNLFFASDYFDRLYELAVQLVKAGKAYVCSLNTEEIREYRGTVKEAGRPSPYRERSVEENLALLEKMRNGDFAEGAHVLRARIDMASPNMKMRDPLIYRIRHVEHHRTGTKWCIYPMYDFAHGLSDSIEGITHSICTLEFENNRELYDWFLDATEVPCHPQQIEFARLNLSYTVLSKRKLLELVETKLVDGWDDPRMPTIAGMRRRGYTPAAIRDFCERIGVAKANSTVDLETLEFCLRDDLNQHSPRIMCVLDPLKVILTNYETTASEEFDADYFPHDVPKEGSRKLPFSREIWIERSDFMEQPSKKYHRLAPGREVRLRHGYVIKCEHVVKDEQGQVVALHCSYDPETLGKNPSDRKIKGTIHWVSVVHALPAQVRLYDRLFTSDRPGSDKGTDFKDALNPDSLVIRTGHIEPAVANDPPGSRYQFERQGYFCSDTTDSKPGGLVFNRTVGLRDSWAKISSVKPKQKEATKDKAPKAAPAAQSKPQARKIAARSAELTALFTRFSDEMGLSQEDADLLSANISVAEFFQQAVPGNNPKTVANWVVNTLSAELKDCGIEKVPINGAQFGALIGLIDSGAISGTIAKQVLGDMLKTGEDAKVIVERKGLRQLSDSDELTPLIAELIEANADKVERYRAGNKNMLGFFVGQVMKKTGGKANPKMVNDLTRAQLEA